MGRLKKFWLHIGTDIAPVSNHGGVGIIGLDILQVIDVMHARLRQVERVCAPAQPADGVQLIPIVVCTL